MRIGLLVLGITLVAAAPSFAQTPVARAQTLASEFSKFKNETRTKKGVSHTKYKEVISEAWIAPPAAYAGRYLADQPMYLEITIDANGRGTGTGRDHSRFQLRNLAIAGGLITGEKAYPNGKTEPFEAVLLKRAARSSSSDEFSTHFGIGLLAQLSDLGVSDAIRIFAEKQ